MTIRRRAPFGGRASGDRALVRAVRARAPRRDGGHTDGNPRQLTIPLGERNFRLSARADRIEQLAYGRYAILDFKTGQPPSDTQVRIGVAPQLTLEGAILRNGGFPGIARGSSLAELTYVRLAGREPAGEAHVVKLKDQMPDVAADHAWARLKGLVRRFEQEATPYCSLVLPMWKNRYGAYDDLARVKEWSAGEEGEEE